MSEDTTMNETELRQAVESMRDQLAALSGRIDGMDRGEILRAVKDDRRDKLSERHAQAFGRHAGDAVPHTYRDYLNPHRIPGMVEVRPYEDAAVQESLAVVMAYMSSTSGSLTMDTVIREDDGDVIECDVVNHRFNIKVDGAFLIGVNLNLSITMTNGAAAFSATSFRMWDGNAYIYDAGPVDYEFTTEGIYSKMTLVKPMFVSISFPARLSAGNQLTPIWDGGGTVRAGATMYVIKLPETSE
jgi:hypothetical protein